MARQTLTGSRIRSRRLDLGVRQSELARTCGISPAYLNLIEHNRRRIGGKLLNDISRALSVEPGALSEGAEVALLGALRGAAGAVPEANAEVDRLEEFAGRFPGWARLVEIQTRRIEALERTVALLSDRLSNDPDLSASLHDVLSTATAIRSTSAILAGGEPVDPEWQARFQRNIHEESQRLAEASRHLVRYLDGSDRSDQANATPQEELESWLAARDFHVPELERSIAPEPSAIVSNDATFHAPAARAFAQSYLARYRRDAEQLPLPALKEALSNGVRDPLQLARVYGVDLPTVLRRLATLPADDDGLQAGLAICDGSGTLTFRKPVEGFSLPRFGAGCPLWPLYQSLARPLVPRRDFISQVGRMPRPCLVYSVAQPSQPDGFDGPSVVEATMLILPQEGHGADGQESQPVGTSCRVCPAEQCSARREPSIFAADV